MSHECSTISLPKPLISSGSNLAGENLALSSSSDGENDGDEEPMSSEGEEVDGPPVVLKTWAVMKSASTTPINRGSLAPQNNSALPNLLTEHYV